MHLKSLSFIINKYKIRLKLFSKWSKNPPFMTLYFPLCYTASPISMVTIIYRPLCFSNSYSFPEMAAGSESVLKVLGDMVMSCYAKYWIFVCGGMFIVVSFTGKLVGYKIIYMLLFLLCLCVYQVRTRAQTIHSYPEEVHW